MVWFIRFILGFPPRKEDIQEIQRTIPELLSNEYSNRDLDNIFHLYLRLHGKGKMFIDGDLNFTAKKLREWLADAKLSEKKEGSVNNKSPAASGCVGGKCLFANEELEEEEESDDETPRILELMTVGGGLNRKEPLKCFLDLITKVHSPIKVSPKSIFITDPYLYVDVSQNGTSGGLKNFKSYLQTLKLTKESEFNLFTTNNPKMGSFSTFEKLIKKNYPKSKIERFKTKNIFHDRFYIVDYGKEGIKGVFGPSINGLTDSDIVLMGEIEPSSIKFLMNGFNNL